MNSENNDNIRAIGLMSGTSLDGLDIAACSFHFRNEKISYTIDHAETIPFSPEIAAMLKQAEKASALNYFRIHNEFGRWMGRETGKFIHRHNFQPRLIASHGHTIFHVPGEGFTVQTGNGAQIAAITGVTTICDFRSLDVALNGQGAPLVPIGDRLLFGQFAACVNIGGFSNISMEADGKRVAWDISPANYILNHYVAQLGLKFDDSGKIARSGKLITELFNKLEALDYYSTLPPKSLGREWVEKYIFPVADKFADDIPGILHTFTRHIAGQISRALPSAPSGKVLFTGGGVYNDFLMELIREAAGCSIVIPENKLVDYKEALVFALLGVLRYRYQPNCLASVTGADADNIGGAIYEGMPV